MATSSSPRQQPLRRRNRALWRLASGASLALVACLLLPQPAQARRRSSSRGGGSVLGDGRDLLYGYSATFALFTARGQSDISGWRASHPATPTGLGVRYHERNGFITGTTAALLRMVSGAVAASGPKSVETWQDSNYRYTRTTYYSAEEKRAITDAAANSAAGMFAAPNQSFDLEIYSRSLGGDADGYRTTWMLGGVDVLDGDGLIDFGLGFGGVRSAAVDNGKYLITRWSYLGIPIRFNYAIGPLLLFGQWDWNWYGHSRGGASRGKVKGSLTELSTAGFPIRVGVTTALLGRLVVEAVAMTPSAGSGEFGFTTTAGLRF